MLFWHWARRPASRAELMAGSRSPTRTPMMLITTSSSMSVKPRRTTTGTHERSFPGFDDGDSSSVYQRIVAVDNTFKH